MYKIEWAILFKRTGSLKLETLCKRQVKTAHFTHDSSEICIYVRNNGKYISWSCSGICPMREKKWIQQYED